VEWINVAKGLETLFYQIPNYAVLIHRLTVSFPITTINIKVENEGVYK